MITDPAFSSPFLPRLTWKRGEKAVYFQVPGYQGIGVIPGLEIGWLAYKSSPFLPRKTGKRAYFRVSNRQRGGLVPGLEAFRSSPFLPRETVFSPLFPHKWEVGKLRKKCHNVPNVSGECLKTRDFEVQSECPNTPATSTIFELKTATIVAVFYHIRFQFPTDGLF